MTLRSIETGDLIEPLRRMGLLNVGESARFTPLTGGVSSDISLVETGDRRFCVKRALPQAQGRRALGSADRTQCSARRPGCALSRAGCRTLFRASSARMQKRAVRDGLSRRPRTIRCGRRELLAGRVDVDFAAAVGRDLAIIHARSAADPTIPAAFANDDTFEAIRIEPYLRATGRAHPDLAARFDALALTTLDDEARAGPWRRQPEEHPCGPDGPVFLDAECAWFGDPAFDLAFCLNHLLLKGAREGVDRTRYLAAFSALADAYLAGVDWENRDRDRSARGGAAAGAVPRRVDGKSPVEYLTRESERAARAPLSPIRCIA